MCLVLVLDVLDTEYQAVWSMAGCAWYLYLMYLVLCIKHILPSIRLLIWKHERNIIRLHVQVFLRMGAWMFETCRRKYNQIKTLMQKIVHFVGSYYSYICTYVHHIARLKTRKINKILLYSRR